VISVVERSRLPASADAAWEWFRGLDSHYRDWHPEHLEWRTLRGEPLTEGAVVFADEWLGHLRLSARMFIHGVAPGRHFAYRFAFPASLVGAGGWFRLDPLDDGACELVQEAHLGLALPGVGALVDRLLGLYVPVAEIRRHMREEQANLVALLAGG